VGLQFLLQILSEFNFKIVVRGWGDLSLFKQNKVRLQFQRFTDRLIIKPFTDEEMASEVFKSRGVILFGNKKRINWNEQDLYFFINQYKTTFLIEIHQFESLESLWKNGDTHWELDKDTPMNNFRKIINQNMKLKFQEFEKISENKNQIENKILRLFKTITNKG
jgi:hypothetical protein